MKINYIWQKYVYLYEYRYISLHNIMDNLYAPKPV